MQGGKAMARSFRKNHIIVFLIMVLAVTTANTQNDEEFFLRGNKFYEQKDYDNALSSYDMMSKKGRAVFYNMGNCYFHKDDYAQALVYWSRAENGATRQEHSAIERNKRRVLEIMGKDEHV